MQRIILLFLAISSSGMAADSLVDSIDKSVDPCVDFYQYACGTWIKKNPLPSDRSRFGSFDLLQDRNFALLRGVLEKNSANDPKRTEIDQKTGDYYAACMDETTINKLGMTPIQPLLNDINGLKDKKDLTGLVSKLYDAGVNVFFSFGSEQDFKDANQVIAWFDQGGMGLPSKDYYFETDAKMQSIREKYVSHIEKTLLLSGVAQKEAASKAKQIFEFEKNLAQNALKPVERRDPERVYHPMPLTDLATMVSFIDWNRFAQNVGAPALSRLNVHEPEFAKGLNRVVNDASLDLIKAYLRWRTVADHAVVLASAFEEEQFDFYSRTLRGQKEMRPRWFRCATKVDAFLGEALGQAFVKAAFPGDSKEKTLALITNLEKSLKKDIETDLPWMSKATKEQALLKLGLMKKKIGYPDRWRDYSTVRIDRADFLGNSVRAALFESRRQLAKIGKPVDVGEWFMTPQTVNAYYNPSMNDINFPAGILQPPFFDRDWPDARNYGGIGMVIGHEITHGFDDQGAKFDGNGNMRDWWTKEDGEAFKAKAQCFVDQYGGFTAVSDAKNGDLKINGNLTLGENAADNGGTRIAYYALMDFANGNKGAVVDGFTPEQQFFLGLGQVWCGVQTEDSLRNRVKTDPHSPGKFRVNGTVQNMPEFAKAFSCKPGQPMAPVNRCRVW